MLLTITLIIAKRPLHRPSHITSKLERVIEFVARYSARPLMDNKTDSTQNPREPGELAVAVHPRIPAWYVELKGACVHAVQALEWCLHPRRAQLSLNGTKGTTKKEEPRTESLRHPFLVPILCYGRLIQLSFCAAVRCCSVLELRMIALRADAFRFWPIYIEPLKDAAARGRLPISYSSSESSVIAILG